MDKTRCESCYWKETEQYSEITKEKMWCRKYHTVSNEKKECTEFTDKETGTILNKTW